MVLSRKQDLFIVLFYTVIAAVILSSFINSPFKLSDHDGAGGCHWGTIARNYLRYGYLGTRLGTVENAGYLKTSEYRYRTDHPPLTPIIVSFGLRIFGVHEWSIRIMFIIFALGILPLSYLLSMELWNRRIANWVCFFTLLTPMYLHFSSVADMMSITLFFSLASIYSYARWLKTRSLISIAVMSITLLLANLSSWAGYYLIPAFLFHNFIRDKKRIIYLLTPALGVLSICVHFIHTIMLVGLDGLISNIKWGIYRTGIYHIIEKPLFILAYLKQISVWLWFLFTPVVIILTAASFIYFKRRKEEYLRTNYDFLALFFIFGILKYFLFVQLCYHHPQRLYYLIPFFSFSAAISIDTIYNKVTKPLMRRLFVGVFIAIITVNSLYITAPIFMSLHANDARRSFRRPSAKSYGRAWIDSKLIEYVKETLGPGDLILTNRWFPHLRFYLDRNTKENISDIKRLQKALEIGRDKRKAMLFIFKKSHEESSNEQKLLEYLIKNHTLASSFNKDNLLVFTF